MDELSNKTLATLLVVAIVISLAGTFFAMRGVTTITNVVTGQAVAPSGQAQVYINTTLSIVLNQALVDFGSGYRNATIADTIECRLNSSYPKHDCWYALSTYDPWDFQVENDGNIQVNVTINASRTGTNFFGSCNGSTTVIAFEDGNYFHWGGKVITDPDVGGTTGGCNNEANDLANQDLSTPHPFASSTELLCENLSDVDTKDTFNVTIILDVPKGPTGNCSSFVTFTAAQNY